MTSAIIAHTFEVDVTPEIGDYVIGGLRGRSVAQETPLLLRGLVLTQGARRLVLACLDYCYTCGRSHRRLEEALAVAAGVPREQATIHSNHVHDAPLLNEEVHQLFADTMPGVHNEQYVCSVIQRTQKAIQDAVAGGGQQVLGVSFTSAPVHQFASNRRVVDENNRCEIRWSIVDPATQQHLIEAPEGIIDPLLDQIVLYDQQERPFVAISSYACHPQVSNGRATWSADTVGVARELFEKVNRGVMVIHFDGCGGDITAGKYSSTNRHRNRLVFGLRLYDGLQAAFDLARPEPLQHLSWFNDQFDMPLREEEYEAGHFRSILDDPQASSKEKYLAGLKYNKLHRGLTRYPFRLSRLTLNDHNMLFLPAELCIEYQLHAKRRCASKLTVAAYGDAFLNYVATDEAFEQGGYEVQPAWTEVGPGCEPLIKRAIDRILAVQ